jgi:uncharacterized protein YdaU (DUF1376 family)
VQIVADTKAYHKLPYYQYYPADFEQGTATFTLTEVGAYQRLLNHQWAHGSVPGDSVKALSQILRCSTSTTKSVWAIVQEKFPRWDDGQHRNARLAAVRQDAEELYDRNRVNGAKGGRPMKPRDNPPGNHPVNHSVSKTEPRNNPPGNPNERQSESESESESKRTRKRTSSPSAPGFDEFWMAYPRKTGKKPALKQWQRIKPDPELTQAIVSSVRRHVESRDWLKDGGQFIPHPSTFLSQERWTDEIVTEVDSAAAEKAAFMELVASRGR